MLTPQAVTTPNRRLTRQRSAPIAASCTVTAVARMDLAKILLKHAQPSISRPILVREISMPLSKSPLSLQSPSQTPLLLSLRRRQAHQQPLSNITPSELKAAAVSRTCGWSLGERLRAALRLGAAARHACLSSCLMLLSWLVGEFLDGCAAYALAMYGIPTSLDDGLVDAGETKPARADQEPAPRAPQLAAVIGCAHAHHDSRRPT